MCFWRHATPSTFSSFIHYWFINESSSISLHLNKNNQLSLFLYEFNAGDGAEHKKSCCPRELQWNEMFNFMERNAPAGEGRQPITHPFLYLFASSNSKKWLVWLPLPRCSISFKLISFIDSHKFKSIHSINFHSIPHLQRSVDQFASLIAQSPLAAAQCPSTLSFLQSFHPFSKNGMKWRNESWMGGRCCLIDSFIHEFINSSINQPYSYNINLMN